MPTFFHHHFDFFFLSQHKSLEIYDGHARALHPRAEPEKTLIYIDIQQKLEKWRVPAQKRRVKEYLVLEKRMWVQGPWVFREQMWPTWIRNGSGEVFFVLRYVCTCSTIDPETS